MAHNYDVGTRVWQPDLTDGWVASRVEQKKIQGNNVKIVFELENGEVEQQLILGHVSSADIADSTDQNP